MILSNETIEALQGFVVGTISAPDFGEWIIAAESDDNVLDRELEALGLLRLLLIEYGEGLRAVGEVQLAASDMLASTGITTYETSSNENVEVPAAVAV